MVLAFDMTSVVLDCLEVFVIVVGSCQTDRRQICFRLGIELQRAAGVSWHSSDTASLHFGHLLQKIEA